MYGGGYRHQRRRRVFVPLLPSLCSQSVPRERPRMCHYRGSVCLIVYATAGLTRRVPESIQRLCIVASKFDYGSAVDCHPCWRLRRGSNLGWCILVCARLVLSLLPSPQVRQCELAKIRCKLASIALRTIKNEGMFIPGGGSDDTYNHSWSERPLSVKPPINTS